MTMFHRHYLPTRVNDPRLDATERSVADNVPLIKGSCGCSEQNSERRSSAKYKLGEKPVSLAAVVADDEGLCPMSSNLIGSENLLNPAGIAA